MTKTLLLSSTLVLGGLANAATLFTSGFNGNTGAEVLAGNTDNTTGSETLTITDWSTDAAVSSISGLTAISSNDGGTTYDGSGFAQLQGGSATYASADTVFLVANHNTDASRADNYRGFSLTFTLTSDFNLTNLNVLSGHTNNTGNSDQAFGSDLIFNLSGGTLGSVVTATSAEDYGVLPDYHSVDYDLTGTTLGAGTYTLEVYQANMPGGGAYATFDGITLEGTAVPEPSSTALIGLAGLGFILRRRR